MKQLDIVNKAITIFPNSYINNNNELILIPKFNIYIVLDDIKTETDFKIKLCSWFSRDCCCALRYCYRKTLEKYWQENCIRFNTLCNTNFTVEELELIYSQLGNNREPTLCADFVNKNFSLHILMF